MSPYSAKPGDGNYPRQLLEVFDSPQEIWLDGVPSCQFSGWDRSVAITGARAATQYGMAVAQELGRALSDAGVTVVSGAAFGIDGAAHRGALASRYGTGSTCAVLPCGIDMAYPSGHKALIDQIRAKGLVMSEYESDMTPSRERFFRRSQLIVALATVVVVVEAVEAKSSSMAAMRSAECMGRPILAVPGPVTSLLSGGPNSLIVSGRAQAVRNAEDVLEALERATTVVAR